LEYAPAPPFDCGTPDSASDELIASYRAKMASLAAARRLEAEQSAARLAACRT